MRELIGNFRGHGVRRIAILNTGVSTEKPLDEVAGELGDVAVLHMRLLGGKGEPLFDNLEGGHADERETSVMLALDPRGVRMDRLAPEGDFKTTAATGDASRASAFKGERLLEPRWTTWWRRSGALAGCLLALRRRRSVSNFIGRQSRTSFFASAICDDDIRAASMSRWRTASEPLPAMWRVLRVSHR